MKNFTLRKLLTVLFVLFATVANAYEFEVDGIYYNIYSYNTVEVTSSGNYYNRYNGSVVIPESVTYNGVTYSVASIGGGAFSSCSGLTSIEIPNSVTTIGSSAFRDCSGLRSVTSNATTAPAISDYTFRNIHYSAVLRYPAGSDYSS